MNIYTSHAGRLIEPFHNPNARLDFLESAPTEQKAGALVMRTSIDAALEAAIVDDTMADFEGSTMSMALRVNAYGDGSQFIEMVSRRPIPEIDSGFYSRTLMARTPEESVDSVLAVEYSGLFHNSQMRKRVDYKSGEQALAELRAEEIMEAEGLDLSVVRGVRAQALFLEQQGKTPQYAGDKEITAASKLLAGAVFLRPAL